MAEQLANHWSLLVILDETPKGEECREGESQRMKKEEGERQKEIKDAFDTQKERDRLTGRPSHAVSGSVVIPVEGTQVSYHSFGGEVTLGSTSFLITQYESQLQLAKWQF